MIVDKKDPSLVECLLSTKTSRFQPTTVIVRWAIVKFELWVLTVYYKYSRPSQYSRSGDWRKTVSIPKRRYWDLGGSITLKNPILPIWDLKWAAVLWGRRYIVGGWYWKGRLYCCILILILQPHNLCSYFGLAKFVWLGSIAAIALASDEYRWHPALTGAYICFLL